MVSHPREPGNSRAARRLNAPRPISVAASADRPTAVGGVPVEVVREEWRVADQWWTDAPVRRRYFDVVLESGKQLVVFLDEMSSMWFTQRP
jgi:hypothetical protein